MVGPMPTLTPRDSLCAKTKRGRRSVCVRDAGLVARVRSGGVGAALGHAIDPPPPPGTRAPDVHAHHAP